MKILKVVEEPEVEFVTNIKMDKTRLTQRRGGMIRSLLEEREKKEKG